MSTFNTQSLVMWSYSQMYWYAPDNSWNLWLTCTNGNTIWSGTKLGSTISDPSGDYTSDGAWTPSTITISTV